MTFTEALLFLNDHVKNFQALFYINSQQPEDQQYLKIRANLSSCEQSCCKAWEFQWQIQSILQKMACLGTQEKDYYVIHRENLESSDRVFQLIMHITQHFFFSIRILWIGSKRLQDNKIKKISVKRNFRDHLVQHTTY